MPEPVTRTMPPRTMRAKVVTADANASQRKRRAVDGVGSAVVMTYA
jgi:hypothetical protein